MATSCQFQQHLDPPLSPKLVSPSLGPSWTTGMLAFDKCSVSPRVYFMVNDALSASVLGTKIFTQC